MVVDQSLCRFSTGLCRRGVCVCNPRLSLCKRDATTSDRFVEQGPKATDASKFHTVLREIASQTAKCKSVIAMCSGTSADEIQDHSGSMGSAWSGSLDEGKSA